MCPRSALLRLVGTFALTVANAGEGETPGSTDRQKSVGARRDAYGDPLPSGARMRHGTARFRALNDYNAVALSPEDRVFASRSGDTAIKLREVAIGREPACLTGHELGVTFVANSPAGKILASIN